MEAIPGKIPEIPGADPGQGLQRTDIEEISASGAAEPGQIPANPPAPAQAQAAAAPGAEPAAARPAIPPGFEDFTDRYGNHFDPELHMVKADGTPRLYGGFRLIGLQGVHLPRQKTQRLGVVRAPALDTSTSAAAEDDDEEEGDEEDGDESQPAAQAEAAPVVDVHRARRDAKRFARIEALAIEASFGDDGKLTDAQMLDLAETAEEWFIEDNIHLPIRARGMHVLSVLEISFEKARTASGKERTRELRAALVTGWEAFKNWLKKNNSPAQAAAPFLTRR